MCSACFVLHRKLNNLVDAVLVNCFRCSPMHPMANVLSTFSHCFRWYFSVNKRNWLTRSTYATPINRHNFYIKIVYMSGLIYKHWKSINFIDALAHHFFVMQLSFRVLFGSCFSFQLKITSKKNHHHSSHCLCLFLYIFGI